MPRSKSPTPGEETGLRRRGNGGNGTKAARRGKSASFDSAASLDSAASIDPASTQRTPRHPKLSWFSAFTTYLGYAVLTVFGHVRDFFGKKTGLSRYSRYLSPSAKLAPLCASWENFYTRRLYHRIQDCWNRPITGPPGAKILVIKRETNDNNKSMQMLPGRPTSECLNLGSYNYLGFADDWQETCRDDVVGAVETYGCSSASARGDMGTTALHKELEVVVAKFVGKPDAVVFNMGYGTNASTIPALMGRGSLIVSDSLNHTSIVNGARASGATVRVFKHNDASSLEQVLRTQIAKGQPRTRRRWTKILVMVEGIYSMEGEICNLREVVAVAKKYKCYIYVDEAHSIGALGDTGRGVCEHEGVDPADVDILMGTFTKSFGGMGGYIASSKQFCDYLRANASGLVYSEALSPVVCQQVLTAFKIIDGQLHKGVGRRKLRAVRENSNFFRDGLEKIGCEVFGDYDSPVIPMMLYNPGKIPAFTRECYKRGLAVVVVGFPATPLVESRARFCISAGHERADLEEALRKIEEVCTLLKLRYRKSPFG